MLIEVVANMADSTSKRMIQPVTDRYDKKKTYQEQMLLYKAAVKYGFWYEAIMIENACLEDRLKYILYYLGVISSESDYKITGNNRCVQCFPQILHDYISPKANIESLSKQRTAPLYFICQMFV